MAVYKCAGYKRGVCDYVGEEPWRIACPKCGRSYDCLKVGVEKTKDSRTNLGSPNSTVTRIKTGNSAFDHVVGGGLVPGSVTIISGPPGLGKSTLILQVCDSVSRENSETVVYASGEQSSQDISLIAGRLKIANEQIEVLGLEGDIEKIIDKVDSLKAKFLVVDSLQKAFMEDVSASVGSVEQGKAVVEHILYYCKKWSVCAIIVSQVNKDGEMAGARAVEHDVDTVLEFDPYEVYDADGELLEESRNFRQLKIGTKNRFGRSDLDALFEMTETGLKVVKKKSKLHLV